jgi:hypothetical protein
VLRRAKVAGRKIAGVALVIVGVPAFGFGLVVCVEAARAPKIDMGAIIYPVVAAIGFALVVAGGALAAIGASWIRARPPT